MSMGGVGEDDRGPCGLRFLKNAIHMRKCVFFALTVAVMMPFIAQAASVNVTRTLPDYAATPGEITATLTIGTEGDGPNGMIVSETIPAGWQVISSNPSFSSLDAAGVMRWVLFGSQASEGATITYTIKTELPEEKTHVFQGYVEYNDDAGASQSVVVGGKNSFYAYYQNISVSRDLPTTYDAPSIMDVSLDVAMAGTKPNGFILTETAPLGLEFVSTNPTCNSFDVASGTFKWIFADQEVYPRTVNYRLKIPSDKIGSLVFSGSAKYNDPVSVSHEATTQGDTLVSYAGSAQTITGTRDLPVWTLRGGQTTGTIALYIEGEAPNGMIVTEYLPAGCSVVSSTPQYDTFDAETGEIKWLLSGSDVVSQEITYVFSAPADGEGSSFVINGSLSYNDATQSPQTVLLVGDSEIVIDQPPAACAGADVSASEGSVVTLDGSGSTDPEGAIAGFSWVQTGGPVVELSAGDVAVATFTAPEVDAGGATLTFELTVTDARGLTDSDTVTVVASHIFLKGDVDGNRKIDLADVVTSLRMMTRKNVGIQAYKGANVNGDEKIGLAETMYILQCISDLRAAE